MRNFNQSIIQTFHENPKESYQLVENGHPMVPFNIIILQEVYAEQ